MTGGLHGHAHAGEELASPLNDHGLRESLDAHTASTHGAQQQQRRVISLARPTAGAADDGLAGFGGGAAFHAQLEDHGRHEAHRHHSHHW